MSEGAPQLKVLAGRFVLGDVIGRGGAATVHLGKSAGPGRRGVVAIKRLHPHLAADPAFVAMMLDEARLMSRVRHENVVSTLDIVMDAGELYIVMEYVHGATLGTLLGRAHTKREPPPVPIACAIVLGALAGLHAAHEATGPSGEPLDMVHRDVSPQNLLVAESGAIKVVDFGIAKAEGRLHLTQDGSIKGKLGYMSPEQLFGEVLDRRTDVYAAGVVLWETLVGERLFSSADGGSALVKSLVSHVAAPSDRRPGISEALDKVVLRALAHDRDLRFASAKEMAEALESAWPHASAAEIGAWVRSLAADTLDERGGRLFVFDQASRELLAELARSRETMASIVIGAAAAPQRRWALGVAAALCLSAGGAAALLTSPGEPEVDAASPPESAGPAETAAAAPGTAAPSNTAPSNTAAPEPTASATAAAPVGTVAPAAGDAPPPAATAEPVAAGPAKTVSSPGRPARPTATTTKPASKPDGCDPPFTIDAQGHKRYKRDCLR